MDDWAIRNAETGRYVAAVSEIEGERFVAEMEDGALMWRTAMDAAEAHEEFGLSDEYEVVRV